MARLTYDPLAPPARTKTTDPMVDLDRLLSRLQQTILRADAERERRLTNSDYERQKLAFNIDYARTLLTRMEQEAFSIKVLTRKQDTQAGLAQKRELLDHIANRLKDLEEMRAHADDEDTGSEGDDILNEIIMTPSESMDSRSTDIHTQSTGEDDEAQDDQPLARGERGNAVETLDQFLSEKPETITSHDLRPRGKQPAPSDPEKQPQGIDTAQTTGASRSLLFGNRAKEVSDVSTTEAILDHQRKEQEVVTEDLLRMASQLKVNSQKFGEVLQEDTEALGHAVKGLDKNELSLEAAARSMGAITKMTEGKGWYGRIMLYAWIYGLMVVLVLLVFALPKLRF